MPFVILHWPSSFSPYLCTPDSRPLHLYPCSPKWRRQLYNATMDSEILGNKNSVLFRNLIHDCPGHEWQYFVDRFLSVITWRTCLRFTQVDSCIYRFPDEIKFQQLWERIFFRANFTAAKLCQYDVDGFDIHIYLHKILGTFHCLSNDGTTNDRWWKLL